MMTVRNSGMTDKKDLHFGGLGDRAPSGFTSALSGDAAAETSRVLIDSARQVARTANQILRENPWAALGLVAAVGLTAGFLLSRRDW